MTSGAGEEQPTQAVANRVNGVVRLPDSLIAENGAKKMLSGEFNETLVIRCQYCDDGIFDETETCEECTGAGEFAIKVPVEWTTIKDIYSMIVKTMQVENINEDFDKWLKTVCFQKPTPEAYDLAKEAWCMAIENTWQEKYNELIMSVGNKFPNETRHETALRYIKSCENSQHESASEEI